MVRHFAGLAWLALLGASVPSITLADDAPGKLLEETTARIKLAKDALKINIDAAISKAGKLPSDAAIIVIQSAENEVNEAGFLTPDEKKGYLATLTAKRKSLESGTPTTPTAPSKSSLNNSDLQANERIREELNIIKALDKAGETAKAKSRLKTLMDKYPNNSTLLAYASVSARLDSAKDQNKTNAERAKNASAAMSSIDGSAGNVPPNSSGVAYDKDHWNKISDPEKGRKPTGSVTNNLTKKEKDYLRILDQLTTTDFNLNETSFEQVKQMLEKELGFPLIISKATMEEVRVAYDTKLTYQIPKNVSKRTLLKGVLAELGMTYILKGELVQIVSFIQAKNEVRVGILDVATVVRSGGNIDDLVKLIKSTVEPDSWDTSGGVGTITIRPPGVLIIKNSAEVIYQLGARPK
ncbi:MAG TPA: hypothetical protein PLN21_13275 [Gemmatales bacterium]|nr:hypothetical protein [Gemmatales bacterium]